MKENSKADLKGNAEEDLLVDLTRALHEALSEQSLRSDVGEVSRDPDVRSACFDPKAELLALKESLQGLERTEKREKIEEYKKQLSEYYSLTAELNEELESRLRFSTTAFSKDAKIPVTFLTGRVSSYEGKLPPEVIARYGDFIDEISTVNQYLQDFKRKNQGKDAKVVFEELFGFTPEGRIEIEADAFNLTVNIENKADLALLFGNDWSDENKRELEMMGAFAGIDSKDSHLKGLIVVIHSHPSIELPVYRQIMLHEQKHILDMIVSRVTGARGQEDITREFSEYQAEIQRMANDATVDLNDDDFFLRLMRDSLMKSVEVEQECSEILAKMEIFAYMKNGLATRELFMTLSDGEYYNVLNQQRADEGVAAYSQFIDNLQMDKALTEKTIRNIFDKGADQYLSALRDALDAVQGFRDLGVSDGKIIGFFQNEPLSQWRKIFDRTKSLYEK